MRLNNKESIPTIYASICEVLITIYAEQMLIRFKFIIIVCIEMNNIVVILEHRYCDFKYCLDWEVNALKLTALLWSKLVLAF